MSDHRHLTFELLEEIGTDAAPVMEAIEGHCLTCLKVLERFLGRPSAHLPGFEAKVLPFPSERQQWGPAQRRLAAEAPGVRAEIEEASRAFEEIALLTRGERQRRLASEHRLVTRALVDRLLDAARATRRADPQASLAWAIGALTVLDRHKSPNKNQCVAALALRANARRATADFRSASTDFARARGLAEEVEQELDLETLGELDSLEASLLTNLRRFDEARVLLSRAL